MTTTETKDGAFKRKLDLLREVCLETNMPSFFPRNLSEFAEWKDEDHNILRFSRPILYKPSNSALLDETKKLIQVASDRWRPKASGESARAQELEALIHMLTSRYHQERQMRLDAEQEVEVLRVSVESLSSKLRELTGKVPVRLVKTTIVERGDRC